MQSVEGYILGTGTKVRFQLRFPEGAFRERSPRAISTSPCYRMAADTEVVALLKRVLAENELRRAEAVSLAKLVRLAYLILSRCALEVKTLTTHACRSANVVRRRRQRRARARPC